MPRRKFSRLTNDQKQALRGELEAKVGSFAGGGGILR